VNHCLLSKRLTFGLSLILREMWPVMGHCGVLASGSSMAEGCLLDGKACPLPLYHIGEMIAIRRAHAGRTASMHQLKVPYCLARWREMSVMISMGCQS
jgi:hypothetical protein